MPRDTSGDTSPHAAAAMHVERALATAEEPSVFLCGVSPRTLPGAPLLRLDEEDAAQVRRVLRAAVRACGALRGRRVTLDVHIGPGPGPHP